MKKVLILFLFYSFFIPEIYCMMQDIPIFASMDEVKNKKEGPYLLVFFSTSCQICWNDLIEMKYFIDKNKVNIKIIGISRDSREKLIPFIEKYSISCSIVNDRKGKLYNEYEVDLEPFKLIIIDNRVFYRDSYYESLQIRENKIKKVLLKLESKFP